MTLVYLFFSVTNFTALGAFSTFVGFSLLFFAYFNKSNLTVASWAARTVVGLMFFIAALHKINPTFVSGFEFSFGEFYGGTRPAIQPLTRALAQPLTAYLTIITEALLGVLCFVRLPIVGILILLFSLMLCIFQPSVAAVYFALLPFVMLGFPELGVGFRRFFRGGKRAKFIMGLAFAITLSLTWTSTQPATIFLNIYCAMAFALTPAFLNGPALLALLRRSYRRFRWRVLLVAFPGQIPIQQRVRGVLFVAVVSLYGFWPFYRPIPEPFSFTMFSARNVGIFKQIIPISDPDLCLYIQRKFSFRWAGYLNWASPKQSDKPRCTIVIHWPSVYKEFLDEFCQRHLPEAADSVCGRMTKSAVLLERDRAR